MSGGQEKGICGMTRRDYELLSKTLAAMRSFMEAPNWRYTCNAISIALKKGNVNFNRAKFLNDCGVDGVDIFPRIGEEK